MSSREDFLIRSAHSQPSTYFPPRCNIGKTEVGASITVRNIPPTLFNEWQRYRHILIKRIDLSLRYLVIRYKLEQYKNAKGYIEKMKRAKAMRSSLGFPTERLEVEEGKRERRPMDESFEMRVKRLFGSRLFEFIPGSSFPTSSWSVADGEVERREWNREQGVGHGRDENPCSSAFAEGGCFAKKLKSARDPKKDWFEDDLDELDGGGQGSGVDNSGYDGDREEREIRSFIYRGGHWVVPGTAWPRPNGLVNLTGHAEHGP